MEQIIAVERNHLGHIISFKTSEGRVISYRKAITEAESGIIEGITFAGNVQEGEHFTEIVDTFSDFPMIY